MGKTQENIVISFKGQLNYDKINELLEDLNHKLAKINYSTLCKKRIYSTSVELLENILRHTSIEINKHYPPQFSVFKTENYMVVESCNLVTMEQRKELEEKIEYINNNNNRLKKIFAEKLKNSHISDEGGAGLGVFIVGKNASRKISYSFQDINEKESYFCLKIKI